MKKELEQKLYDKYPKLFFQKDLDMKETCMCWGIECPDSWYHIIDIMCQSIQSYIDIYQRFNKDGNWRPTQISFIQIKEKYGQLTVYYSGMDEHIDGIIAMAEELSKNTCAICGNIENIIRTEGWITYLCKSCCNKKGVLYE